MEGDQLCFPHLNTSCRRPQSSWSHKVLIFMVLTFISVLTTTLNLLVIISISHYKQLHSPTNLLLLSLAVSDFFVGFLMFFQILLIDGCWYLGDLMCDLYSTFDFIITSSSVGNMVLISADRYVAICDPLHYSSRVSVRGVSVCSGLCWICSVLYNGVLMRDYLKQPGQFKSCAGECVVVVDYVAGLADVFFSFIGPVSVIMVLYLRVFVVAVSQARVMRSQVAAQQSSVKVTVKKSELKAARTLGVVVVVFLLCLCPYFCVTLSGQDTLIDASSAAFVICLFYFNSCLNPLIYAFFYPWFRKSVRLIVTLQILKPGSCDTNMLQRDAKS
ncbi:trace amine-associated receptor 7b-like [Notolabrus celidotus]|uniref:trace amine-associated receptor 7b-like n=1 Tax=Notolabrus celidotus TaxID=1203425 RepID=UPI0014900CFE|nr:trace amine-associated receptor 7b-like [Notolabrus celidotus]